MNGYIDIHTHILPGVDDGALDVAQGLDMVRIAYQNGTRILFLTPHYRSGFKQNDHKFIKQTFDRFCEIAGREVPGMKLYLGCEIRYEMDAPEAVAGKRALSMNGSQYCLMEFHPSALRSWVVAGVWEMIRFGYIPIIAHPERYAVFRKDRTLTDEVLQMGALLQLNAESILGRRGLGVSMFCNRLLKERKAHFVASDAHNAMSRPPLLRDCWWKVYKRYGGEYARKLFHGNAQRMIADGQEGDEDGGSEGNGY